jgi:DNA-directed RNA polymerase I, II, and III subunit RPABC2
MDFEDENAEPDIFDEDDPQPDENANEDPDAIEHNQENQVITSGDPQAAAAAAKSEQMNTVKSMKDKKVPNDKRTTTPYMTKYERARVLGTRALQIR